MSREALKAGTAFRSRYLEDDLFVFVHPCPIIEGDGLFRHFNVTCGFIEPDWYRFNMNADHLQQSMECEFVG